MEIAPIPGLRGETPERPAQGDLRPPAIFEIDSSAKPGDGSQQRNGRKAAGAEENEEDDVLLERDGESVSQEDEGAAATQVDYFA